MIHEAIFGLLVPLYCLLVIVILFILDERDLRRERDGDEARQ